MRRTNQTSRSSPVGKFPGTRLHQSWEQLHHGDREPWPDEQRIARLGKRHADVGAWADESGGAAKAAQAVQGAWSAFHAGDFHKAIQLGSDAGALGASAANKAAAIQSLAAKGDSQVLQLLESAIARGEAAVAQLPDYPNAHYLLALALGRYSQRISILRALADGLAGRIRTHLDRTLELEPRHAEAHVALGLYHAEIVNKLGGLAASLTHGASREAALDHFRQASRLAPASPIVQIEHANGLLLLDADRYRDEAVALYARAAGYEPLDAMEQLDIERARRGVP